MAQVLTKIEVRYVGAGVRRVLIGILVMAGLAACGPRTEPYRTAPIPSADGFRAAVPAGHTVYDNASLADLFA